MLKPTFAPTIVLSHTLVLTLLPSSSMPSSVAPLQRLPCMSVSLKLSEYAEFSWWNMQSSP